MKRHPFDVPEDEALRNLSVGLRVIQAEKDLRHPKASRVEAARHTLATFVDVDTVHEDESSCRDADPELFFPYPSTSEGISLDTADQMKREAQKICSGCPVARRCLEKAIGRGERYGVWGGLDVHDPANSFLFDNSRQRSAS